MRSVASESFEALEKFKYDVAMGKRSGGKWKYIELNDGTRVKVDASDFERVNQHSWRKVQNTKTGKISVITSIRRDGKNRSVTLGKFLMKPPKGKMVYPRRWQGGLDYRKENLIVCTMSERQRMLPKRNVEGGSSLFRGVSYIPAKKVWRARIEVDGESEYLGDFSSEREAALAYNKAALKYFGKYAYVNQVDRVLNERRKKKG